MNYLFSPHSSEFLQKRNFRTRGGTSNLLHVYNFLFHCAIFHLLLWYFWIYKIKSDSVNIGKQMRWIFVRKTVKCGESFFFNPFTAFLTLICHKNWCGELLQEKRPISRWIFVGNKVKCGESFIFLPHSPHFLH